MRDEDSGVQLGADHKASKAIPKQAGISWSLAADRRLDQLLDLANDAGANTHRNELAAAIIADAEAQSGTLFDLVVRWRQVRVDEVILDVPSDAEIIYLPLHGRGRRRKST